MSILLGTLLVFSSMFLIMIVLVQRGRGGGLTGALGGAGGQSAFGAKAGDVFTRITIGAAAVWIVLCVVTVKVVGGGAGDKLDFGGENTPASGEAQSGFTPGEKAGATATGAAATGTTATETEKAGTEKPATETSEAAKPATETPAAEKTETPAATETPATEAPATPSPAAETPATPAPAVEPAAPETEPTAPAAEKSAAE